MFKQLPTFVIQRQLGHTENKIRNAMPHEILLRPHEEAYIKVWSRDNLGLRLFQHTFGTHPEQPLPTGYDLGFLSYLPGDCQGCAISGCGLSFSWNGRFSKLHLGENPQEL